MKKNENKIIAFDIDGIITNEANGWNYSEKTPNINLINKINILYNKNTIVLFTARNSVDEYITKKWLKKYEVKYHSIIFNKPMYDYFIDDKAFNSYEDFEKGLK